MTAVSNRVPGSMEEERGLVFRITYTLPSAPFSFGTPGVVVEVSWETGQGTILRYAVHGGEIWKCWDRKIAHHLVLDVLNLTGHDLEFCMPPLMPYMA